MNKKMRIKTKIVVAYLLLLMLSFVLTFSAVFWINRIYTKKEVEKVGTQTVNALTGNLSLIFDNVTQFSDLVYFDDQVQRALKNVEDMPSDPGIHRMVQKSLTNMILACDYASGVYIWDSCGNFYSSYKKRSHGGIPPDVAYYDVWKSAFFHDGGKARLWASPCNSAISDAGGQKACVYFFRQGESCL